MKKLVALFLALVMTLSLCTVAFADSKTIADILPDDFPEYNAEGTGYWVNKDKAVCFIAISKTNLIFRDTKGNPINPPLSAPVVKVNDNKWTALDGIIIFNLQNNELKSIQFSSSNNEAWENYVGIYTDPNADDTSINWEKLVIGAAITTATIHTVKAIKNYKAEKAAAAEAAKLAEMPMVAMGDSGDAVTTLQTELNAQGYACGEVDGVFGQNTLNAVMAFQTAKGLTADGIVGVQTWGALL